MQGLEKRKYLRNNCIKLTKECKRIANELENYCKGRMGDKKEHIVSELHKNIAKELQVVLREETGNCKCK